MPEPHPGEVYFEFTSVGGMVRVAAVDAVTGAEVVIVGPAATPRADLQALALRKLRLRLSREAAGGA